MKRLGCRETTFFFFFRNHAFGYKSKRSASFFFSFVAMHLATKVKMREKSFFRLIFYKKFTKNLRISKKSSTFAPLFEKKVVSVNPRKGG